MANSLDRILFDVSKPARYTGGEWNSIVKTGGKELIRFALAFPDIYEIGMSNMAIPILCRILNNQPDVLAERVYAPWIDMEAMMRRYNIPLFSLESKRPLADFDIVGFSLGYELAYTNVINMLDLAHIPPFNYQRDDSFPLVIAGGSSSLNPEPMADFFDLFVVGDAEDAILQLLDVVRLYQGNKNMLLLQAAMLPGIYVPSLYHAEYGDDGNFAALSPTSSSANPVISRQIVTPLPYPVTKPVVPYIEVVHDRGAVEIRRGCSRGCRFCQAGMIYRPVRELPQQDVVRSVTEIVQNCGYSEVSLVSLSTGDYCGINELIGRISQAQSNLSISLPSLRLDTSSLKLIESLPQRRKTTLTFAPEAGSERLRQAINKIASEELILDTLGAAFEKGWLNIKLYFMIGLPTETMDDVKGIIDLVTKICKIGRRPSNKSPRVRISVATFVPKPHTPCQWAAQEPEEKLSAKQDLLRQGLRRSGAHLSWHDPHISLLEAALSRGDRRLGNVIYKAWQSGCRLDTWSEHFKYDNWLNAFAECGLDPAFFASRERSPDEPLPWQHIDIGVTRKFLQRERQNISLEKSTPDCRYGPCSACGLQQQPECQQKLNSRSADTNI